MIVVVNYELGNLGSILNMLRRIGHEATLTSDPAELRQASKIVLPGVGSFDQGMRNLTDLGLVDVLNEMVLERGTPVLGICLGAQLMLNASTEGERKGLGWVNGRNIRFFAQTQGERLKVPHMGWSDISLVKPHPLFNGMFEDPRFYFVHSYHFVCENEEDVLATTTYGYGFQSAFSRGNICGVQFHPEKSHKFGMRLFENFAAADVGAFV